MSKLVYIHNDNGHRIISELPLSPDDQKVVLRNDVYSHIRKVLGEYAEIQYNLEDLFNEHDQI